MSPKNMASIVKLAILITLSVLLAQLAEHTAAVFPEHISAIMAPVNIIVLLFLDYIRNELPEV